MVLDCVVVVVNRGVILLFLEYMGLLGNVWYGMMSFFVRDWMIEFMWIFGNVGYIGLNMFVFVGGLGIVESYKFEIYELLLRC